MGHSFRHMCDTIQGQSDELRWKHGHVYAPIPEPIESIIASDFLANQEDHSIPPPPVLLDPNRQLQFLLVSSRFWYKREKSLPESCGIKNIFLCDTAATLRATLTKSELKSQMQQENNSTVPANQGAIKTLAQILKDIHSSNK